MQFPTQAIRSPKHFRYKPVPKTRTDLFSIVRDPAHCSSHGLVEHFILLNSRLHDISVESKNTRIRVWMRKLWSSEVGAADLQGWCGNSGTPLFSILPKFAQFWDAVVGLSGPGNSYTLSMAVPQSQTTTQHINSPGNRTKPAGHYTAPECRIEPR